MRLNHHKTIVALWKRRPRQLATSGVAQDSTVREHRGSALPCLGYLAQFVGPPPNILRVEQELFAAMTRVPLCACPRALIQEFCQAAQLRAASQHGATSLRGLDLLQQCRDEHGATCSADLMRHDVGWDAPPLAARMVAALVDGDLRLISLLRKSVLGTRPSGFLPPLRITLLGAL